MGKQDLSVAHEIAQAANAFEQRRTGHAPKSVTVILSGDTLVITLLGALTPAEKALAESKKGAAMVQEFHRQFFGSSSGELRQEIKRVVGVEVREASAEVEPTSGTVTQVFLLAGEVPASRWGGDRSSEATTKTEIQSYYPWQRRTANRRRP